MGSLYFRYLNDNEQKTRFTDNRPGRSWMEGFFKRHNLTKRIAQNLKPSRGKVDVEIVDDFFNNLKKALIGKQL